MQKEQALSQNLALLIDSENASAKDLEQILTITQNLGNISVKRLYGNFASSHSSQWKELINQYALKPIQQFAYVSGKNTTDSCMIIDAMDLLYSKQFDGFCLVSSDSDFTALAIRLREQGMKVYGFGKAQTPISFQNACSQFSIIDSAQKIPETKVKSEPQNSNLPQKILKKIFEGQDEWLQLSIVGSRWRQFDNAFSLKKYGSTTLKKLVLKYPNIFECKMMKPKSNKPKELYVKLKNK